MKYVEGAQRRRDPANRQQSSTFYVIEVTQASCEEQCRRGIVRV